MTDTLLWILAAVAAAALAGLVWRWLQAKRARDERELAEARSVLEEHPDDPLPLAERIDTLPPDATEPEGPLSSSLEEPHDPADAYAALVAAMADGDREAERVAREAIERLEAQAPRLDDEPSPTGEPVARTEPTPATTEATEAGRGEAEAEAADRAAQQAEQEAAEALARAQAEQAEAERQAAEAAERAEAQRRAAEQAEREAAEAARAEAERQAAEAAEIARAEAERQAAIRAEEARLAAEQAEREAAEFAEATARAEAELLAAEAAARADAQRLAAEQAAREAAEAAQAEADRRAAEAADAAARAEAERLATEQAEREAALAAAAAALAPPPVATRPLQPAETIVMVVDDSKIVRVKTSRALAPQGYQLVLAESGEEAVAKMAAQLPHVIITDVEMPGMDGFELTRLVRSNPLSAHLPVIMITGADDRQEAATAAGVTELLGKPYSEDRLIACIEQARLAVQVAAR
jgi:PleD family two-component response regulator